MHWNSSLATAGHAAYLAGAFGMAFALVAIEMLLLYRRSRACARR